VSHRVDPLADVALDRYADADAAVEEALETRAVAAEEVPARYHHSKGWLVFCFLNHGAVSYIRRGALTPTKMTMPKRD
jgi:hypothetical protein